MIKFNYKKDNGDTSERDVIPIGFNFGDRDTVLCIDLSQSDNPALDEKTLEQIRQHFLDELYDLGYGSSIRSFHADSISGVTK